MLDVLFRDHRDTEAARACFWRILCRAGIAPATGVSDPHQPYLAAVQEVSPEAAHVPTGLHWVRGETTKSVERSHLPIRDRLRASRVLKTLATGQRCFHGFEARYALRRGHGHLEQLVPGSPPLGAIPPQRAWAVVAASHTRGTRLTRAA